MNEKETKTFINNCHNKILFALAVGDNNQLDSAITEYQNSIQITAETSQIYKEIADICYFVKNNPILTIKYYTKFLDYNPDNTDAKACLGLAYLKTKHYKEGWEHFEFRPHKQRAIEEITLKNNSPIESKPLWHGENIENKTIYVYPEAGFGDTLMFARFLPRLKTICKKVLFEAETSNLELFKNSNLGIEILDAYQTKYPDYDVHIPLMSLPYFLKLNTEEDLSIGENYLKSDSKKVEAYKEKYFNNKKLKIGIKWRGNPNHNETRKLFLKSFYKLFDLPNTQFYSVQKGAGIEQLEEAKQFNIIDLGSTFQDFSDTAAAIENLDLIICNDTSIAHLAGILKKKCWIMLPFAQDWRWSTDLSYCYWYKTARLFKQKEPDSWDEVLDRVLDELKKEINSGQILN